MERKQREWSAAKQNLEAQIETLGQEAIARNTAQQKEFRALEKRGVEAESQTRELREKLQALEKERRLVVEKLEVRETALREELQGQRATLGSLCGISEGTTRRV